MIQQFYKLLLETKKKGKRFLKNGMNFADSHRVYNIVKKLYLNDMRKFLSLTKIIDTITNSLNFEECVSRGLTCQVMKPLIKSSAS